MLIFLMASALAAAGTQEAPKPAPQPETTTIRSCVPAERIVPVFGQSEAAKAQGVFAAQAVLDEKADAGKEVPELCEAPPKLEAPAEPAD